jgi:transcriptional regulator with XRE-family HTH domain
MADTMSAHVRGTLRAELARREISQTEAAERLGVHKVWVNDRLTGKTRIGLDDLARFADLLDIPVTHLVGEPLAYANNVPPGTPPPSPPPPPQPGPQPGGPGRRAA